MLIHAPCPACGKQPWRPRHAASAHGADVSSLDALQAWAADVSLDVEY